MDGFTPIDHEVREEIRTNLAGNLCVEAGAGTGKTRVLVDRIVEILRTGHAAVDEIAVITFTEKAAAELAGRVREALEHAHDQSDGPAERARLAAALSGLSRARIETVHAFAGSLLRERPVEAGLDPGFEQMDGLAADLALDEAFRTWQAAQLAAAPEPLRRALNRGADLRHLRQAALALHDYRELLPLAPFDAPAPDLEAFVARLEAAVAELAGLLDACRNPDDYGAGRIERARRLLADCRAAAGDRDALERRILQAEPIGKQGGSKANWSNADVHARQKEIGDALHRDLEETQAALRSEAAVWLLSLAEGFVREYEAARRAAGRADFHDLLVWARNLLRDHPAVRTYFQGRFRCILVDEFQDTDPLQVEILLYLCSSGDPAGGRWSLRPDPGRLFVVGDPKQSIYRFRRADIAVYERVKRQVLGDGLRIIRQNFRSLGGVIGWVNRVFQEIIVEEEGVQPAYAGLEPLPTEADPGHAPVVVIPDTGDAGSMDEVRAREAVRLAALIRRAVEEEAWPVRDPDTGDVRPVRYRDVAVLLPARTGMEHYQGALDAAGVPYRHEGGREFFDRQEVRDLRACLRAVDDPTDRLSLVAALRSGAFGCSDEEIFRYAADGGELDLRRDPPPGHPAVAEALAVLRRLHGLRRELPLAQLVQRALDETRLVEFALTLPQGDQAAANLLKVVDQARAFEAARGARLRAFVRWLAASSERGSDEADAAVAEAGDDVVRLLTIHAAKGLEFPIVALANLNSGGASRTGPIPDHAARRLHLRLGTGAEGYFQTPGFDEARESERRHQEAERRRLLYVAATRARDRLIIPVAVKDGKPSGMLADLLPHLPEPAPDRLGTQVDGHYLCDPASLALAADGAARTGAPDAAEVDAALRHKEEWEAALRAAIVAADGGLTVTTASSVESWDRMESAADDEPVWYDTAGQAAAVGLALHAVMETIDLAGGAGLEAAARARADEHGVPDRAGEVAELARRCLASPVVVRALRSGRWHREASFSLSVDGAAVEGRMDLLFQEDGGLVIVDYKTDRVLTEPDIDRRLGIYRNQAAVYAFAASRATGLPVKEVVFVFARPGVERSLPADDELLELGERLAAGGDAHGAEPPGEAP